MYSIQPNGEAGTPRTTYKTWIWCKQGCLVLFQERFDIAGSGRKFLCQGIRAFGWSGVKSWGLAKQAQAAIDRFEGTLDGSEHGPTCPVGKPCRCASAIAFIGSLQPGRDTVNDGVFVG